MNSFLFGPVFRPVGSHLEVRCTIEAGKMEESIHSVDNAGGIVSSLNRDCACSDPSG